MKITEIVDSQTDNITSKNSRYKDCGIAGSAEATKPIHRSVSEMQKSQAAGAEGIGLNEQSHNDDLRDFNQGVSINGEEDNESPSQGASLPFLR